MQKYLIELILISIASSWKPYRIQRDHHYSNHECVSFFAGNVMRFDAVFSRRCLYDPDKTDGEGDLNKLYGFVDCGLLVHENSARFAWRHDGNGTIEIFAYLYVNGERNFFKMGDTHPMHRDAYEIHADADRYYFRFNAVDTTLARASNCRYQEKRMRSFPYFGGDVSAPNTMVIWVKEYRQPHD